MRELEDVLVDYFAEEELSPEESRLLTEWLEKEDNAMFVSILKGMCAGSKARESMHKNPEQGMRAIRRKIDARYARKKMLFVLSAAACLLFVVGIVFLGRKGLDEVPEIDSLTNSTSLHEKSCVHLRLANGKVVPLHANRDEVIVADSFMSIMNSENTLVYHSSVAKKEMEYNTVNVPLGTEYNVVLSDGTKVYLNADSKLRFPEIFSGRTREVYLEGEGYFEVAKDSAKTFIVHTKEMKAMVLGTSFNVKSYQDQEYVETTLVEGRLKVICQRQEYDVLPNHQIYYDKKSGKSSLLEVNTDYFTSWKDGYYWFNEVTLEKVMDVLAKWYSLEVFYVNDEVKKYNFSGRLKRYDDFSYLLKKFEETGDVGFSIDKNVVIVRKK